MGTSNFIEIFGGYGLNAELQGLDVHAKINRLEIDNYVLFVKKNYFFTPARFQGYQASDLKKIRFHEDSFILDYFRINKGPFSQEQIADFYENAIIVPKDKFTCFREEIMFWQILKMKSVITVRDETDQVIAFFVCDNEIFRVKPKMYKSLIEHIQGIARYYFIYFRDKEVNNKLDFYRGFYKYIRTLINLEQTEDVLDVCFHYINESLASSRAFMFSEINQTFTPIRIYGGGKANSYKPEEFEKLKRVVILEIKNEEEFLGQEFGLGKVLVIWFNANIVYLSAVRRSEVIDYAFIDTVSRATKRFLNDKKKKSNRKNC